jgi:hypothetical protein
MLLMLNGFFLLKLWVQIATMQGHRMKLLVLNVLGFLPQESGPYFMKICTEMNRL